MNDTVGSRIRAKRQQQSLTHEKLAEKLDVSTQFIYQVEHDVRMPSVANLIKLSDILDVSIDFLLKGREIKKGDELELLLSELPQNERDLLYKSLTSIKNLN